MPIQRLSVSLRLLCAVALFAFSLEAAAQRTSFDAPRLSPVEFRPNAVVVADFNGDGTPDLAVGAYHHPNLGSVSILLGKGDGAFRPGHGVDVKGDLVRLAVGDFNRDGKPDLAVLS